VALPATWPSPDHSICWLRFFDKVLHLDFSNDEVRSLIRGGASPLRVCTCALAELEAAVHVSIDGPICDIGCASGSHFRFFSVCACRNIYLGVDVMFNDSWTSERVKVSIIPCRFAQMSAINLGVATESFAFTYSSSALEHIPNIQQVVCEMARALRPGAFGLHIVPGVWSLFLYLFHGYRRFFPRELADLFETGGLKV